jgi:16S rRNA (guanine966-N2)-methyltransferase
MRIISGTAGGIPLKVPQTDTRPTTDRVREALFSMLTERVPNAHVLDLFAGSGSLGLEALSRGAASALFIEQNRSASDTLRQNLTKTRLPNAHIRQTEVFRTLSQLAAGATPNPSPPFNLIFADPPYPQTPRDTDLGLTLLQHPHLPHLLAPDHLLILETRSSPRDFLPPAPWQILRQKDYGTTRILLLQHPQPCSPCA